MRAHTTPPDWRKLLDIGTHWEEDPAYANASLALALCAPAEYGAAPYVKRGGATWEPQPRVISRSARL
jgi:hypothetical protein